MSLCVPVYIILMACSLCCTAEYPQTPGDLYSRTASGIARKPQPVGGVGGADPSVVAGTSIEGLSKHRQIRVTQPVGGYTSIKLA